MSLKTDLSSLKQRLAKKKSSPTQDVITAAAVVNGLVTTAVVFEELEKTRKEVESLKNWIRELYFDALSCEDARDFTLGTQEAAHQLISLWGESPMTAEEYMEKEREAEERARDEAELARLAAKLGKNVT